MKKFIIEMQHKFEKEEFLKMQYDQYLYNMSQTFPQSMGAFNIQGQDVFMQPRGSKATNPKTVNSVETLNELNQNPRVEVDCVKSAENYNRNAANPSNLESSLSEDGGTHNQSKK